MKNTHSATAGRLISLRLLRRDGSNTRRRDSARAGAGVPAGRWIRTLVLGAALVLAAQPIDAQVLYGSLLGKVQDTSRAVLPGATVTVTNRDTGLQRETTTDGSGSYAFQDLQPGIYDLQVTLSGFKSYVKAALRVTLNTVARADVQMEVGGQTETVTVTATALLQTERADVSTQLMGICPSATSACSL